MKIQFLLFIAFLIPSFDTLSQTKNFELKIGDFERKSTNKAEIISSHKNEKGNLILLKREKLGGKWDYVVEERNENLKVISSQNISKQIDAKNYMIEELITYQNQLVLVSSSINKKEKTENYFYQDINLEDLSISEKVAFLSIPWTKERKKEKLQISLSSQHQFLLISLAPKMKSASLSNSSLILLNEKLEIVWKKERKPVDKKKKKEELQLDKKQAYKKHQKKDNLRYLVSNRGIVYSLQGNKLITIDSAQEKEISISLDHLQIHGLKLSISQDDQPIVSGYYSLENTKGVKGVFYFKYNPNTLEIEQKVESDFSKELIQLAWPKDKKERKDKAEENRDVEFGAKDLYIDAITFDSEGNMYLIGSQFQWYVYTYIDFTDNYKKKTRTTYYYCDIYVSKFNGDGELIYHSKIPKKHNVDFHIDPYSWFLDKNNSIHFIFKDHIKNETADFTQTKAKGVGTANVNYICSAQIDKKGIVKRTKLYDYYKEGNSKMVIKQYLDQQNHSIILANLGQKHWQLFLVESKSE